MALGKQVAEAYIEVNGDLSPFRRDLERARLAAARANKSMEDDSNGTWKRIGNNVSKAFRKIQGSWSRMDRTVKLVITLIAAAGDQIATLGSGLAAGGTALISTFGMALANLIPLVALLPGLAYGIGLAVSAIGRMKDAGGEAAKAIASIGKAYRDTAVPAFTKEWERSVTDFSKTLADKLGDTSIPTALGKAFSGITDAFTGIMNSPSFSAFQDAMSTTLAKAIENLGIGIANVTRGFMELFAAAGPAAERLTNSFRQWGNAWADSMSRMRQDGTLQRVFDTAYTSGAALMNLGGALGRALGSVFMIGAKYGDDLANSLAAVTNQFTAWSKTAEGQLAINQWFANGVRIIKAMEPAAVGLGRAMAILVTEKSISQWEGINQSMGRFLPMLAEVLRVIGSLDLIGALVALLEGMATALAVMSGPLDQIATVLGGVLRSAVDAVSQALIGMGVALVEPLNAAVPGIKALGNILSSAFAPMAQIFVDIVRLMASALTPAIQVISSAMVALAPGVKQIIALFDVGLRTVLTDLQPIFKTIGDLLGVVAIAFGQLAVALLPSLALLATAFTGALSTLMPHLTNLVNVIVGGLQPVFSSLGQTFAVLGPRLAELTGMFLTFISQGIAGIAPIIDTIAAAFAGMGPVISTFVGSLGTMFAQMLPTLQLMGHAFLSMLPSIQVVADVIGKVFVAAISALLPVIMGLMPVIGKLVADLAMFAAGVAPLVANVFANIMNALIPLLPIIMNLVGTVASLAATFIGQLLPAILPILEQFGTVFTGILLTLMPYITQFVSTISQLAVMFISQLLPALIPILTTLGTGLMTILQNLAPVFLTIVTVVGDLVLMFMARLLPALMPLMSAIQSLVSVLVAMLVPAFQVLGAIITAVMPIIQFIIQGVIDNIIGVIQGLTRVIQGIADFFNAIFRGDIAGAWNALVNIVLGAVEAIWNFVQLIFIGKLLAGIKTAVTSMASFISSGWSGIVAFFKGALDNIVGAVSGGFSKMINFVTSGMNNIRSFFTNAWNTMIGTIQYIFANMGAIVSNGINGVINFFAGLGGRILGVISAIPGQVASIGRNIMQGMIDGIVGMAGNLLNSAMNAVKGAVDGVKNFLGIRSPSRLFMGIGEYMGEGAAIGMDNLKGRIKSSATKMAEAAVGAFDRSKMFITGLDAGAGIAQGLLASKSEIAGALSGMSKSLTVSTAAIGTINPSGISPTAQGAAGQGRSIVVEEGAIQVVTPVQNPGIVASKVVDELVTSFSML